MLLPGILPSIVGGDMAVCLVAELARGLARTTYFKDKPIISKKQLGHKIYPYLIRGLAINRANQVWALDTTYIPMAKGFIYLTAVVDWASRKVLAAKVAITLETCHAVDVLQEAFNRHGTPERVNTDQGSQFTAEEFVKAVEDRECSLGMDGRGAWRDNVFIERLWKSVKYERVYLYAYISFNEARRSMMHYVNWYNQSRPHSQLGRKTPDGVYANKGNHLYHPDYHWSKGCFHLKEHQSPQ